jgi:hypothetical protein
MGVGPKILCDNKGSEGLSHQIHLFKAEVLPYGLQITGKIVGSQERRVGKCGAPATSLVIKNDHMGLGELLEIRTDIIEACAWPTVNHDDRVLAGSGHFVEDLGTTRPG